MTTFQRASHKCRKRAAPGWALMSLLTTGSYGTATYLHRSTRRNQEFVRI
jgi:hypothetical protein